MPGDPERDDWFRPVWDTGDEAELDPPGTRRAPVASAEPDYRHPLLEPLARAQDAVTQLETRADTASPAVAEGLVARMSYREAAGWLAHAHVWIHPHDLALRDRGLTGSFAAAFRAGRLRAEIPSTAAHGADVESVPSDITVDRALRLARLWRRLSELRTWRPLADADAVHETLQGLGSTSLPPAEVEDWLGMAGDEQGPLLIRAGRAARDWMNRPGRDARDCSGIFLAACLWGTRRPIPLPFWSAPEVRKYRLELHVGVAWLADFLDCIAAAANAGLTEMRRLQSAEDKGRGLGRTARSRLSATLDAVLRVPLVTARDLARTLDITPQAALALLRQLAEAGLIREVTGRASWRAFALR